MTASFQQECSFLLQWASFLFKTDVALLAKQCLAMVPQPRYHFDANYDQQDLAWAGRFNLPKKPSVETPQTTDPPSHCNQQECLLQHVS